MSGAISDVKRFLARGRHARTYEEIAMDDQPFGTDVRDATEKVGAAAGDLAAQGQAAVQNRLDQGRAIFQDLKTSTGEAVEKATAVARDLSAAGTQAAAQAGELIKGAARDAGNQAGQAATALYQQGANAGGYLARFATEQPITAMLVAAACGYGLAYLIHRR
jgi:ElaB/YqjD/DUF883 family membrane-anchored ribosome-binding protein